MSLWGVVGYGEVTLTLTPEGQAPIETDMDLMMAALDGRGVVAGAPAEGGVELSVTSDGGSTVPAALAYRIARLRLRRMTWAGIASEVAAR